MADFTVYSYQCCPILVPAPLKGEITHDEFLKLSLEAKKKADMNMMNHQQIIDDILTKDAAMLFKSQKSGKHGKLENCLAFV